MRRADRAALICTLALLLAGTAAVLFLSRRAASLERMAAARRDVTVAAAGFLEECKARAAGGAYAQDAVETSQSGEVSLRCGITLRRSDAGVLYGLVCSARAGTLAEELETSLYVPDALEAEG